MEERDDLQLMTEVWVRWQQEGFHNWPDAPVQQAYLRNPHRHMFWYEVRVNITGLGHDRSLEFHNLLQYCRSVAPSAALGSQSCEMLATTMAEDVWAWLQATDVQAVCVNVTVSEDNECGATVTLG